MLNSSTEDSGDDREPKITTDSRFMYLNTNVGCLPVTALLDTGSDINIISKQLYDTLPQSAISDFEVCQSKVVVVNNYSVNVFGTANIQLHNSGKFQSVLVYILDEASHPMTGYLKVHKIVLDFSACSSFHGRKHTTKVLCKQSFVVEPNSECMISGKLSANMQIDMQGICESHPEILQKGLLVCKALVSCTPDHIVQVNILNPTSDKVHVYKRSVLCYFKLCDNTVDIFSLSCNQIQHVLSENEKPVHMSCSSPDDAGFLRFSVCIPGAPTTR